MGLNIIDTSTFFLFPKVNNKLHGFAIAEEAIDSFENEVKQHKSRIVIQVYRKTYKLSRSYFKKYKYMGFINEYFYTRLSGKRSSLV